MVLIRCLLVLSNLRRKWFDSSLMLEPYTCGDELWRHERQGKGSCYRGGGRACISVLRSGFAGQFRSFVRKLLKFKWTNHEPLHFHCDARIRVNHLLVVRGWRAIRHPVSVHTVSFSSRIFLRRFERTCLDSSFSAVIQPLPSLPDLSSST